MINELLISGSVYALMKTTNWIWYEVKRIAISDNIEIARRGSSSNLVLEHLKKAKVGILKHQRDGYPGLIKKKQEDMGLLLRIINDLIVDLEENPENLTQIKQKLAISGIDFERIVKRNHYYSLNSPALGLTITSEAILIAIIIMVLSQFLLSISDLGLF